MSKCYLVLYLYPKYYSCVIKCYPCEFFIRSIIPELPSVIHVYIFPVILCTLFKVYIRIRNVIQVDIFYTKYYPRPYFLSEIFSRFPRTYYIYIFYLYIFLSEVLTSKCYPVLYFYPRYYPCVTKSYPCSYFYPYYYLRYSKSIFVSETLTKFTYFIPSIIHIHIFYPRYISRFPRTYSNQY